MHVDPAAVFVAKNGGSDKLPDAFLGSLHAAAISSSYEEGVRHTLKAGGEGMSGRAMLVRHSIYLPYRNIACPHCFTGPCIRLHAAFGFVCMQLKRSNTAITP